MGSGRGDEPRVELGPDGVEVDAALLARAFDLEPAEVPGLMRSGAITSRHERGEGEDAGTRRLTFFHASRRLTLIVDDAGRILRRSVVAFGDRPLPPALRRR
jgi:hypothetical protein